ncbi:MAG TPA: N-acetyltransferase [Paracoccaceae bacterium]|nr:N-acetyltransferase [Paracoccaceae bacterium]
MPQGRIEIRPVETRAGREAFIRLPGRLAAGDPTWIEPLHFERRRFLSPRHNPVFEHADVRFWLALRDGRPAGRISAQIDRLAPRADDGVPLGFFGMADAREDDVLAELFRAAESWLAQHGVQRVRGPFDLSVNQSSGLLVDGFDTPPAVMMEHHDPWLGPAIERQGYAKARDLIAYRLHVERGLPERLRRMAERSNGEARLRPLDFGRYAQEIRTVTEIFNDAWAGNWGFVPMTEAETEAMAKEMRPILPPGFVWFAEIEGRPVGFIVMIPNVNEALRGLGGRLLPTGWARLAWRLKVSGVRTARVPLMGVRREVAATILGKNLPLRLIYALEPAVRRHSLREIEISWLLEGNRPMRRLSEAIGCEPYKTYRVFEKDLA